MAGNRRRWYAHPLSVSVVVLAAAVLLHAQGLLTPLEGAIVRALTPLHRAGTELAVRVRGGGADRRSVQELQVENFRLAAQLQSLARQNQLLREQLEDFQNLQLQLSFSERRQLPLIPAHVIGKDLSVDAQTIVIDRGQRSGVRAGLPVISGDGVIVGLIREAGAEHAKVVLLTDARMVTPAAVVTDATDVSGVVSGEYGVSLKLDLVPKSYDLTPGAMVVTSGLEADVPRGLLIGTVTRVESPATEFFHQAFVQPLLQYQGLTVVGVIVPR